MLSVFLFDESRSRRIDDVAAAFEALRDDELLWVVLRDPTEEDVSGAQAALGLTDASTARLRDGPGVPGITGARERAHVSILAVEGSGGAPELVSIECLLGTNWILTAHPGEVGVLEDFRERAEGGSELGTLDALSFLAILLDWVVASYLRATEEVERELEELDSTAMSAVPQDATAILVRLVKLRRTIGVLRRALVPHQEVIRSLAQPELDTLSSEESARRFAELETRVSQAFDAIREAKESVGASFEILTARAGQRTNEIMKALTLVTVILLPASVVAGVMGMNFKLGFFDLDWPFWVVVGAMLAIAGCVLAVARWRQWI